MPRTIQHICITDDDYDDYFLFKTALKEVNASVRLTYFSCCDCLMSYLKKRMDLPDLIVLDVNMPKTDGYDCLLGIKRDDHVIHIPVVIYSTSRNPFMEKKAFDYGASKYFVKPDSFDILKRYMKELLAIPYEE